jgi:hypothetical protein
MALKTYTASYLGRERKCGVESDNFLKLIARNDAPVTFFVTDTNDTKSGAKPYRNT